MIPAESSLRPPRALLGHAAPSGLRPDRVQRASGLVSPFVPALGDALAALPPELAAHFAPRARVQRYRGTMRRCWRARGWRRLVTEPFLRLAARADTLFPETGRAVPFELENRLFVRPDGRTGMTWTRHFDVGGTRRRFHAVMVYDARRGTIVDELGRTGRLAVELEASVRGRALAIVSGRQRLRVGPLAFPLPRWLAGTAHVREWCSAPGRFEIRVTITNPLLGAFVGYRGSFALEESSELPAARLRH